jgi:Transposase DDE domain
MNVSSRQDGKARWYSPGMSTKTSSPRKKPSSVRHTRAIQRDRQIRPNAAPPDAQIAARLADLVHPATYAQMAAYQAMGLRERILTLPVMVAFVLSLIWRQLGSVSEAVRVLQREGFLWTSPQQVSQQALCARLQRLPAVLFEQVLADVLPQVQQRATTRARPLPPEVADAQRHFAHVLAVDGSTLDSLLRKVGLLRGRDGPVLAGRLGARLDIASHLPRQVWYEEDSAAHDARFWDQILAALPPQTLLLFDLGFRHYARFASLTEQGQAFVTRVQTNAALRHERTLATTGALRDRLVWLGAGSARCQVPLRLVEWTTPKGAPYRYLTNVVDPTILSAETIVLLYGQRWRMEEAFQAVKRLLGLAYFHTGAVNGIQVQVWATWLLYAVLVDLTDAVAEELHQPLAALSLEMTYRGLYHFTQAAQRSETSDPVAYLAAEAKSLGLLKRPRRNRLSLADRVHLTNPPAP